ncbi:hypothetical protein C8Q72DRAFT_862167 [Fomitopsis betulina]|nr:hypothetical protein C8Q72DRAFT_862167 [Fomitopsis betulina]
MGLGPFRASPPVLFGCMLYPVVLSFLRHPCDTYCSFITSYIHTALYDLACTSLTQCIQFSPWIAGSGYRFGFPARASELPKTPVRALDMWSTPSTATSGSSTALSQTSLACI